MAPPNLAVAPVRLQLLSCDYHVFQTTAIMSSSLAQVHQLFERHLTSFAPDGRTTNFHNYFSIPYFFTQHFRYSKFLVHFFSLFLVDFSKFSFRAGWPNFFPASLKASHMTTATRSHIEPDDNRDTRMNSFCAPFVQCRSVLKCAVVCCSVLQRGAVCCSAPLYVGCLILVPMQVCYVKYA